MKRILLLTLCAMLAACADGDHEDVRRWMEDNSRDLRGRIAKLPEVLPYQPVPYEVESLTDPFRPSKIEPDAKYRQGNGKGGAFQPDFEARDLRNEVLEKYPLESLTMIGRLVINGRPIALIKYEDRVRQVKVGGYIGLDFGVVTAITENEVKVKELVQDSAGDWSERSSSLLLQSKEGIQQ